MLLERDWYGEDWRILRKQLIDLCLLHSTQTFFLDEIKMNLSNCNSIIDGLLESIREDISKRIPLDKLGLWQNCLSLFFDADWFIKELKRDLPLLTGLKKKNVSLEQVLGRKFSQYFERNRRELIASGRGISSNRIKTWERLDRISRTLTEDGKSFNRCFDMHFEKVAKYIKINHSHDKNLPRTAKKVKEYFYEFSKDCTENIVHENQTIERLSLQETKRIMHDIGIKELLKCIEGLSNQEAELIDFAFNLQMLNINYLNENSFKLKNNLNNNQFKKQKIEIIDKLRNCLELLLTMKQGGLGYEH